MREAGVIRGFRVVVDPAKLGRDHVAFVEVRLTDTTEKALRAFNAAALKVPEIEQCHMIAGAFDYLLKVQDAGYPGLPACAGRGDLGPAACGAYVHPCVDGGGEGRGVTL